MGRFSPVDSIAGVAKPPIRPRSAMNTDSRRIDSHTATPVSPKTSVAGMRCHRAYEAKSVA